MIIEVGIPISSVEEIMSIKHSLAEPIGFVGVEYDDLSDTCVLVFEADEEDISRIDRGWDGDDFAFSLLEEAI